MSRQWMERASVEVEFGLKLSKNLSAAHSVPDAIMASNELVELIRKLRWMGMEEEAKEIENQLILSNVPAADSVVARSRETD